MKKTILIFLTILFLSQNSFSQSDEIYNQEFSISNFKIIYPKTIIEKSGITVSFDLKMNAFEDYFFNQFYFTPNLKYNEEQVNNSALNEIYAYAKPDSKQPKISKEEGLKFFIPYDEIDLDKGSYSIDFEINAHNEFKDYGVIFTKKIEIKIPQLYYYQEQEFQIRNLIIKDNIKMYDLRGINVKFDCEYKFLSHQIVGVSQAEDLKDFYFFIELENIETGEKYSFFDDNQNTENKDVSELKDNISFFIPYHDLNIPKGKQKLKANLKAGNKSKNIIFETISETNFTINQPQVYFVRLELKELVASYYKYDTPNIFGKIFSKRGSNKGHGYPDIFWVVNIGRLSKYYSETNKNSFVAYAGVRYFTVTDSDPINITAYDYDIVGKNDLISKIIIKNNLGEDFNNINYTNSNNLDELNLTFQKILPANFRHKKISITPKKYENVSGVEINFNYEISSIFENDLFTTKPIIKQGNQISDLIFFINTQENNFEVNNRNLKNDIKIFVPYFNLQNNSEIGFSINSKTSSQELQNAFNNQNIEIPQKVDDIKIELEKITELKIGDYYGVNLKFNYKIPDLYLEKSSLNNLEAKIEIINTTKNKDLSSEAQLIDDEFNTLSNFNLDYTNSKNIFIPFYLIGENDMTYNFNILSEIKSINNEMTVGNENFNIKLPVSNLNESEIKKISLKFRKNDFYDKIFITIEHGKNTVYQSDTKNYSKKTTWKLNNEKFTFHKKDNIYVTVFGMDKYGLSSVIKTWELSGDQFSNKNKLTLKGRREVKKIKIEF